MSGGWRRLIENSRWRWPVPSILFRR